MPEPIRYCFERYEKKYLLTKEQKERLLTKMRPHLTADAYGEYTILNTYYDTDDFLLIRTSLEKPVYKEKLRVRGYGTTGDAAGIATGNASSEGDTGKAAGNSPGNFSGESTGSIPENFSGPPSGKAAGNTPEAPLESAPECAGGNSDVSPHTVFVELKKKFAGIVYKRRITVGADAAEPFLAGEAPDAAYGQIGREISWFQTFYHTGPKVFIGYDRQAFAGTDDPGLRITFDRNLRGRTENVLLTAGDGGDPILPDDRILMEIKLPGVCPLWLSALLSEEGIFGTSFSKYGTFYQQYILPDKIPNSKKGAFLFA